MLPLFTRSASAPTTRFTDTVAPGRAAVAVAVAVFSVAALLAAPASATPIATLGGSVSGTILASEDFEGLVGSDITTLTSGGFIFTIPTGDGRISTGFGLPGQSLYQSGGAATMTRIALDTGSDLDQLQFDISNGFGPSSPQFIWIRTYLNGSPTGVDFDFDVAAPSTFLISDDGVGTGFDEVRVQAYIQGAVRDQHSETNFGAAAIDNVFAAVPEPGTGLLVVLGLVALRFKGRPACE
jgi:hypothetical protein